MLILYCAVESPLTRRNLPIPTLGERIDKLNEQYDKQIERLEQERQKELTTVLAESGLGVTPAPSNGRRRGRPKKKSTKRTTKRATKKTTGRKGSGKRLTKANKAKLVDKALELFNQNPGQKFSRSDIAETLNVKPTQVQTILKEVQGLKSEGNKASTVYFVK